MRGLRASVFIEVTLQKNIGRFVDIESGDSRKWNGLDLLEMKASRATNKVFDPRSTEFIWGCVVCVEGTSVSRTHIQSFDLNLINLALACLKLFCQES